VEAGKKGQFPAVLWEKGGGGLKRVSNSCGGKIGVKSHHAALVIAGKRKEGTGPFRPGRGETGKGSGGQGGGGAGEKLKKNRGNHEERKRNLLP